MAQNADNTPIKYRHNLGKILPECYRMLQNVNNRCSAEQVSTRTHVRLNRSGRTGPAEQVPAEQASGRTGPAEQVSGRTGPAEQVRPNRSGRTGVRPNRRPAEQVRPNRSGRTGPAEQVRPNRSGRTGVRPNRSAFRKSQKMNFQEVWDSCAQNRTSEISKRALSGIPGLLFAEQNVGNLKHYTFRNSATSVRRTRRRKSQKNGLSGNGELPEPEPEPLH